MSQAPWIIHYHYTIPPALTGIGCSPLLAAILHRRGITDPEVARRFLSWQSDLSDPFLLTDMDKAVARLRQAIARRERIAIYGDYDVDGITSTCLVYRYLCTCGVSCVPYIPNRLQEGYGMSKAGVATLHQQHVSLIVTVDCGITATQECAYAKQLGMDVIITDHHECPETLPDAVAVVNPKRPDSRSPCTYLAGVGVAFKLLCALDGDSTRMLYAYADLIAMGTIADVMPMIEENRRIIRQGLDKLSQAPQPGLLCLMRQSGLGARPITATKVSFALAPRINAAGRLGLADTSVQLLLSDDMGAAARLAEQLCEYNRQRQAMEIVIWEQAQAMLDPTAPPAPLVLAGENWHQGVIGIVASRIAESNQLPCIMISLAGDVGKGSCRSWGGFNLFEALCACSEHLLSFGGHALAAGLTIERSQIGAFRDAMRVYYEASPHSAMAEALEIDLCVDRPELIDLPSVRDLAHLEPCGSGNPAPILGMCGVTVAEVSSIGNGKHLRARFRKFEQIWNAVFFSHTLAEFPYKPGDYVDIAFQPQVNTYYSRQSVQLILTDIRTHDTAPAERLLHLDVQSPDLSPETLPPHTLVTPERADFECVWRSLVAHGRQVAGSLRDLAETIAPGMRDICLILCLKVFEELGLLRIQSRQISPTQPLYYQVSCAPAGRHVSLDSSRLLQALRARTDARF